MDDLCLKSIMLSNPEINFMIIFLDHTLQVSDFID